MDQLRDRLSKEKFAEIWLEMTPDGEAVDYAMRRGLAASCDGYDQAYDTMMRILRDEGYRVGISELGLIYNGDILDGLFLTRPLNELCEEDVQQRRREV